jgi:choline dehydrogenase-like flavoprotein
LVLEQKHSQDFVNYEDGRIKVTWTVADEELCAYNRTLKKLMNMLSTLLEKMVFQLPLTEDWLWSGAHHSGTISLGEKGEGVVDKNLKLNACENVFICDGSVIQEHSYANTGLAIGSLAMRLASRIRCE